MPAPTRSYAPRQGGMPARGDSQAALLDNRQVSERYGFSCRPWYFLLDVSACSMLVLVGVLPSDRNGSAMEPELLGGDVQSPSPSQTGFRRCRLTRSNPFVFTSLDLHPSTALFISSSQVFVPHRIILSLSCACLFSITLRRRVDHPPIDP